MPTVSRWLVPPLLGLLTLAACIATPLEEDSEKAVDAAAQAVPDAMGARPGCLAAPLLSSLGKSDVLVGGKMREDVASQAPFDIRYIYLAGGLFDSAEECTSCSSCSAGGNSCANSSGGCTWWGCWQWDQQAPGQFLRDFLQAAADQRQIPMLTYYQVLHTSGAPDGTDEVLRVQDVTLMRRYFNDWRFVLRQIGTSTALLHLEPDFWAYAQFLAADPRLLPAAVAAANPTDCGTQENSVAGMGRCLISMVRKYAPNAKVGLHASAWATKLDAYLNTNPLLDVTVEARKVADFLRLCGAAEGDFIVIEASDRDAEWYEVTTDTRRWWDPTNANWPNFRQAFTWARALSERLGRPHLWWQLPVGNMSLPGTWEQWRDNRLDYFFDHPEQVAAAHGFGMVFGSGAEGQTNPSTDNGHFLRRAQAYFASGGQAACPSAPATSR
ncbi:hypothetical protein [Vitiosangium sp. GDMCC 1.1324]|uniref:hypothetical protein n=1 Tax=Vitiosangium sp. (strain GDMCC 1.1324) TaxID=2138576 RepID=UPI000D3713E6|nr:hypothetical protein [Vitiosangium sp. GDMCC 1.1324]PTL83851.1 hypothetical protein DAT35_10330 [Vitiosangium sp. GDMCC 1.1324]